MDRGTRLELSKIEIYNTKVTTLPVDPRKLYCTPVIFARFFCDFLSFRVCKFPENPKPDNPVKLL